MLLLFGCAPTTFTVGNFLLDVPRDAGIGVSRADGKALVSDLRFSTGEGTATIEMMSGSYLVESEATYTPLTPVRGSGEIEIVTFQLRDDAGEDAGLLQISAQQDVYLAFALTTPGNRVRWDAACTGDDHFVGGGQHAFDVDHVGEAFPLWVGEPGIGKVDTDDPPDDWQITGTRHASSYPDPFFVRPEPMGVMVDTGGRVEVDLCTGDRWRLDTWSGESQYILVDGETPLDVVEAHAMLVGPAPELPTWALAPWNDAVGGVDRVLEVATKLREAGAPSSVIWTEDWRGAEYTAWGYHLLPHWEIDEALYPDASTTDAVLEAAGFKWFAYFSPFLVEGTPSYEEAESYVIRDPDGGTSWFLGASFEDTTVLDLTRADARAWAVDKMLAAAAIGFDGWMADFAEWLPPDAELASADAVDSHNAYPVWWQETNEAAALDAGKELVYFTRSGWNGTVARSPAHWAGDQRTSFDVDDGYPTVLPMSLGAAVSGIAWYGSDIAGYQSIGNAPSTKELWFRWCTLGAFSPLMRTHHGAFKDDNWQFDSDEETLAHFARYAREHAALYPYLRSLGVDATAYGTPLLLPPFLRFPDEPWDRMDAWLLGPSLFVAPVLEEGATEREVSLPGGTTWYDWWTGAVVTSGTFAAAMDEIPVFAPAGAVVPMFVEPPASLLSEELADVTTLPDADGARRVRVFAGAPGSFREADGTSYSTDGVATHTETVTVDLLDGEAVVGGLTLTIDGPVERAYTIEVWAP